MNCNYLMKRNHKHKKGGRGNREPKYNTKRQIGGGGGALVKRERQERRGNREERGGEGKRTRSCQPACALFPPPPKVWCRGCRVEEMVVRRRQRNRKRVMGRRGDGNSGRR